MFEYMKGGFARCFSVMIIGLFFGRMVLAQNGPAATGADSFRDAELARGASVLVSRMSLEQKAAQMEDQSSAIPQLDIPAYGWWNESLHGVAYAGRATNFPQAIGLAATWDTDLLGEIGEAISIEARAKHNEAIRQGSHARFYGLTLWSPNVNIFRDPRWGRGQETYGEDPVLTSKLAVSFVSGMQGNDPSYWRVIATPKHFAVHSGPEQERHKFNAQPTPRDLEETYLPAFRAVVTEGHAGSIMCAYNAVGGVPACASEQLINETLRKAWGFNGYVVSDCGAIDDIFGGHKFTADGPSAAAAGVRAGTDLDCGHIYGRIPEAVQRNLLAESDVDQSVRRLMIARMRLGILQGAEQGPYAAIPMTEVDSAAHRALALRAAQESIVLLKNDGNLLPLRKPGLRVAVIGPAADYLASIKGNYAGTPSDPVVPLAALRKQWGEAAIRYAQGSAFVEGALLPIPRNHLQRAAPDGGEGLTGEYYNNLDFSGKPVLVRTDASANLDFTDVSPGQGVVPQAFAARWTAWLTPPAPGKYRIGIHLGPCYECKQLVGYRMYLDGQLLLDSSTMSTQAEQSDASLQVDFADMAKHLLRIEYTRSKSGGQIDIVWRAPPEVMLEEALKAVRESDVAIAFVGLSTNLEGEEMKVNLPGFSGGDRNSLDLPAAQESLLEQVAQTGKPLVVVLQNGSALGVNWAKQHANAIVEAWYPGQEGGTAIAETLAGENNPGGRLPVTFYKSVNDLPPFEDYRMKERTYRFFSGKPLFPFGFGLSYTQFSYSAVRVSATRLKAGEDLTAKVLVTNSGTREGDEVVQFYTRQLGTNDAPRVTLKAFARIHLKPGEKQWVSATLSPRDLSTVDEAGKRWVAQGAYELIAGGCQPMATCQTKVARYRIVGTLPLER